MTRDHLESPVDLDLVGALGLAAAILSLVCGVIAAAALGLLYEELGYASTIDAAAYEQVAVAALTIGVQVFVALGCQIAACAGALGGREWARSAVRFSAIWLLALQAAWQVVSLHAVASDLRLSYELKLVEVPIALGCLYALWQTRHAAVPAIVSPA